MELDRQNQGEGTVGRQEKGLSGIKRRDCRASREGTVGHQGEGTVGHQGEGTVWHQGEGTVGHQGEGTVGQTSTGPV